VRPGVSPAECRLAAPRHGAEARNIREHTAEASYWTPADVPQTPKPALAVFRAIHQLGRACAAAPHQIGGASRAGPRGQASAGPELAIEAIALAHGHNIDRNRRRASRSRGSSQRRGVLARPGDIIISRS